MTTYCVLFFFTLEISVEKDLVAFLSVKHLQLLAHLLRREGEGVGEGRESQHL